MIRVQALICDSEDQWGWDDEGSYLRYSGCLACFNKVQWLCPECQTSKCPHNTLFVLNQSDSIQGFDGYEYKMITFTCPECEYEERFKHPIRKNGKLLPSTKKYRGLHYE